MNNSDIAIIIPAYNEVENLRILLKDVRRYLPDAQIIIVDDSPVKTDYPGAIVISRQRKLGRGSAVLTGFSEALKDKTIKYLFEMDADLAHSPSEFERFLVKRNEADMIIGSRYLGTSRIVKWPKYRLIQSKLINTFLNMWLGLNISDYTNGFRLYSRVAAEFLVRASLKESGFIALSEIAYRLKKNGFRITEVPISFRDRTHGASNANIKEVFQSLIGAIRIRYE